MNPELRSSQRICLVRQLILVELLLSVDGIKVNEEHLTEAVVAPNPQPLILERLLTARAFDSDLKLALCYPLIRAASAGHLEMVEMLFKAGEVDVNARYKLHSRYDTLLHYASRSASHSMVSHLLSKGADPDAKNRSRMTPLIVASVEGRLEAVKLPLATKKVNIHHKAHVVPVETPILAAAACRKADSEEIDTASPSCLK